MRIIHKLVLACICATALFTLTPEAAKANEWGVHSAPWVQHNPYGGPGYGAPMYGTPHGVRRPGRFVCGADIYTGQYNCVRRKKAHFVRPLYYAPGPVHHPYRPHRRHHGHGWHRGW